MSRRARLWVFVVIGVWLMSGCGDDTGDPKGKETETESEELDAGVSGDTSSEGREGDTDTMNDAGDTPENADLIVAKILVPDTFEGTPMMLSSVFYTEDSEGGMPDAFGQVISNPEVEPGGTISYTTSQAGLEGAYYFSLVLYCVGGGAGQFPVAGVDWLAGAAEPLVLGPGTGTIDAGEMTLFLTPDE